MARFWDKQRSRLIKEATSIKQLDRIKDAMDHVLDKSKQIGAYYVNILTSAYTAPIEQIKKEILKQEEEVRQKAIERRTEMRVNPKNPLSGCAIM